MITMEDIAKLREKTDAGCGVFFGQADRGLTRRKNKRNRLCKTGGFSLSGNSRADARNGEKGAYPFFNRVWMHLCIQFFFKFRQNQFFGQLHDDQALRGG